MIRLFLKPLLIARGIDRPFNYLVNAGFSPSDVRDLLNNDISHFSIAQINKLCSVLNCSPKDLLLSTSKIMNMSEASIIDAFRKSNRTSKWLQSLKESSQQELSRLKEVIRSYKRKFQ